MSCSAVDFVRWRLVERCKPARRLHYVPTYSAPGTGQRCCPLAPSSPDSRNLTRMTSRAHCRQLSVELCLQKQTNAIILYIVFFLISSFLTCCVRRFLFSFYFTNTIAFYRFLSVLSTHRTFSIIKSTAGLVMYRFDIHQWWSLGPSVLGDRSETKRNLSWSWSWSCRSGVVVSRTLS